MIKRKKIAKLLKRVNDEYVPWYRRFLPNRIGWQPTVTISIHEYRDLIMTIKTFSEDLEYIAEDQYNGVTIARDRIRKFNS